MSTGRIWGLVPVGLALASVAGAVPAVEDVGREERARSVRESSAAGASIRTANDSEMLPRLPDGDRVEYAQVLERPDDVTLNFLFAQTQIRDGDLRGASATLERILLVHPELARVRVLYAVVLFRLDDVAEAKREFQKVLTPDIPAAMRAEVEAYLVEIDFRDDDTRYAASLTFGGQYDTNRNAGPASGSVLFNDIRLELDDRSKSDDDFAVVGIVDFGVEHDLETQAGHQLIGSFNYYGQKQFDIVELDLNAVSASGGGVYRTQFADFTPRVHTSVLTLGDEKFLHLFGGSVEMRRRLFQRFELVGGVLFEYQDYDDTDESPELARRGGTWLDARLGGYYTLSPRQRMGLEFSFVDKRARKDWWAFHGAAVQAEYTMLLGAGQFVSTQTSFQYDDYDDNDPFVGGRNRVDRRWRSRLTYGAPLGLVTRGAEGWSFLEDVLATVTGEYFNSDSNVENYTYDNWKMALLFTKSLRF